MKLYFSFLVFFIATTAFSQSLLRTDSVQTQTELIELKIPAELPGQFIKLSVFSASIGQSDKYIAYRTPAQNQVIETNQFSITLYYSALILEKTTKKLVEISNFRSPSFHKGSKFFTTFEFTNKQFQQDCPIHFRDNLSLIDGCPANGLVNLANGETMKPGFSRYYFDAQGNLKHSKSFLFYLNYMDPLFFPAVQGERLNMDSEIKNTGVDYDVLFDDKGNVDTIYTEIYYWKGQIANASKFLNRKTVLNNPNDYSFYKYRATYDDPNVIKLDSQGHIVSGIMKLDQPIYQDGKTFNDAVFFNGGLFQNEYVDADLHRPIFNGLSVGYAVEAYDIEEQRTQLLNLCKKLKVSIENDDLKDSGFHFVRYQSNVVDIKTNRKYYDVDKQSFLTAKANTRMLFYENIYCPRSKKIKALQ